MINVVLTGLNGYGGHYIEPLLEEREGKYRLVAVVSRNPKKSEYYQEILDSNISIYSTLEECVANEKVDFLIISTPMHIHYKEVMCALEHKISVYCEKPLSCTLEQSKEIEKYAQKQKCIVAVGYQWSYSNAILNLKRDLLAGKYGKIENIKTCAVLNRDKKYYSDSNWKGRKYGLNNEPIFESVISNVASHSLHNMLFLLGERLNLAIIPEELDKKCYRAHDIETFDTVFIKMKFPGEIDGLYIATTAGDKENTINFEIKCEKGVIKYPYNNEKTIVAELTNGNIVNYGSPDEKRFEHFIEVIDCLINNNDVNCDAKTIIPIATVIDTISNCDIIEEIDRKNIIEDEDNICVKGINDFIFKCYENNDLSEVLG